MLRNLAQLAFALVQASFFSFYMADLYISSVDLSWAANIIAPNDEPIQPPVDGLPLEDLRPQSQ